MGFICYNDAKDRILEVGEGFYAFLKCANSRISMKRLVFVVFIFFSIFSDASQIIMLREACENGHSAACYELGLLHEEGIGLEQNLTQARKYYLKSCNDQIDEACYALDRITSTEQP